MALTPAEKSKAYRDRKKAARKPAELLTGNTISIIEEGTHAYLKEPFFEDPVLEANYSNVTLALELIGIEAPTFEDDSSPSEHALDEAIAGVENPFPGAQGSIGRAEVMIDCLLDAASEMAAIVNAYKRRELQKRISEIYNDDTLNKSETVEVVSVLNGKLNQLTKQVRRPFPRWRVTGQ